MRVLSAAVLLAAVSASPALAEIALPDVPGIPPAPAPATGGAQPAPKAPAAKADAYGDRLRLSGGDSLQGSFAGFDAKTGLSWKHKDGLAVFQFRADNLDRVDLSSYAPRAEASDLRMVLSNGDTLLGKLVDFTPERVVVETWYAGRLTVPSSAVRSLVPIKNAQGFILAGPGKAEDWQVQNGNKQSLRIVDGQMVVANNAWAGRELELPAKYKIDLEVAGRTPNFTLGVLGEGVQIWGGNNYTYQFYGTNGGIQRCSTNANGNRQEGVGNFRFLPGEGNSLRVALFVDTEARQMTLVVNGQKVSTTAIAANAKIGRHIVFAGQNGNYRVSKIQVDHWSGQADDIGAGAAKRPATDVMVLANKDQMSGQLLGIKEGKASFKAEFATMEVPLDRIRGFELAGKNGPAQKPGKGAVQLFFGEGERLTLVLEGVKDGKVSGASPAFGPCTAELAAFRKALFNLDAPFRAEAKPAGEGGEDENLEIVQ